MSTNTGSFRRCSLISVYLGIVGLIVSCTQLVGDVCIAQVILQLEDGIIEVPNQDGDWEPMAGDSTFELVARGKC